MNTNLKPRRTRVSKGILVGSTNQIQLQCIKCLTIEHHYNPLNFKRIRRVVLSN
jgi:hypothetical protein